MIKLIHLVTKKNKWLFIHQDIARSLAAREEDLDILCKERAVMPQVYLIYIVSFIKLIILFIAQSFKKKEIDIREYNHIFLSTQDEYDSRKYKEIFSKKDTKCIVLNAFDMSRYSRIVKIDFSSLFFFYREAVHEAQNILIYNSEEGFIKNNIPKSLSNLAHYAFLCAFMQKINYQNKKITIFHSGATLSATAALNCNIKTNYLTHGLIGRTAKVSFPNFDKVYVYSQEEKDHLEDYSKEINIYPASKIHCHQKKVIVFLRKFDKHMSKELLVDLISYCQLEKYEVILKPHPSYKEDLCFELSEHLNLKVFDRDLTASELLNRESPAITAGWLSTALCESLNHDSLPISLADFEKSEDSHSWSPIIYPFEKRTLSWINENQQTREAIENIDVLANNIEFLKKRS